MNYPYQVHVLRQHAGNWGWRVYSGHNTEAEARAVYQQAVAQHPGVRFRLLYVIADTLQIHPTEDLPAPHQTGA